MNMLKYLSAAFILLWIAGCSPVTLLHIEQVQDFSVASYNTFDFYEFEVDGEPGPEFNERVEWIKAAIAQQLQGKGLIQSKEAPDLLINIGMAFVEQTQTRETDFRTDAPGYVGNMNYSWQSEVVDVRTYKEGTVVVHMVNSRDKVLLWEGILQSVAVKSDEASQKNIAKGAELLFKNL